MTENHVVFKDGRKLAYIEYGSTKGDPVFLFHGTPGSKLWFTENDATAKRLGLRLITTDRPGYGTSTPKTGRTVLDWADDVAELADQLSIGTFAVMGGSGGGAYAAACAYRILERIRHVSMVASIAPFHGGKPPKSMLKENRIAFMLSNYAPWLLKWSFKREKSMIENKPDKFVTAVKKGNNHLCEWDKQFVQTDNQIRTLMAHLGEALRVSVDEVVQELKLLSRPWGFAFEDISIPVHIWHGEADRMAPFEEILNVAQRITRCEIHCFPGAGHFLTDDPDIWSAMLQQIKTDLSDSRRERH